MFSIINARVIKNLLALIVLQGGNYLLPIILIPFLIRVLGMETFGDWVFAVSFVSIFRTFVAYGFDMTATRAVSVRREDRNFVSKLYVTVVSIRLMIFVLTCLVLLGLAFAFTNIWNVLVLALLSMLVLIGEAFFPTWLFQGMENMATITQLRLGYRVLFILGVILLVRSPKDVLIIPIIEAVGSLGVGLVAMRLAQTRYDLNIRRPTTEFIKREVVAGASVFLSNVAVHFYTTINTILIGVFIGPVGVAKFSIADKIFRAIWGMLGPVVQAIFPTLSRLYAENPLRFQKTAQIISVLYFLLLIMLSAPLFLLADTVVTFVAGTHDATATRALEILAITLSVTLGTLFSALLVVREQGRKLIVVTYSTMIVNLIVIFPLLLYYGVVGAAAALLIGQLFHTSIQIFANADVLLPRLKSAS